MRIILYDDELFEPITVFDVPQWAVQKLKDGQRVYFHFAPDPRYYLRDVTSCNPEPLPYVTIWFEKFIRRENVTFFAFTRDFEAALKLMPDYLPGQVGDLRSRCEQSFVKGLVAALGIQNDS